MSLKNTVVDEKILATGIKAGTTSGWTVGAANNLGTLGTVAASQTAATAVLRVDGLKVGDTIEGFYVIGSLGSAGGTVTLDVELRKLVAAAATSSTDSSVASMTQLSKTANTLMNSVNTLKSGVGEVVVEGASYYFLLTATTAGSTNIVLQAVVAKVRSVYHK